MFMFAEIVMPSGGGGERLHILGHFDDFRLGFVELRHGNKLNLLRLRFDFLGRRFEPVGVQLVAEEDAEMDRRGDQYADDEIAIHGDAGG
jgi:hypothetical protein